MHIEWVLGWSAVALTAWMVAGCGDGPAVGFSVEEDPVPVREVLPTAVEGSPLGSKLKTVPIKLVSPDELLPHVPTYADLKPIDQQRHRSESANSTCRRATSPSTFYRPNP